MKFPYGVADFVDLRRDGQVYVDRTDRIAVVEDFGKALLFLRPRRFGKSLWLSTLAAYYDINTRKKHPELFGDLAVGREPTPLAHRYFVMRWDFSKIHPVASGQDVAEGTASRSERIAFQIRAYLEGVLRLFRQEYAEHLPSTPPVAEDPFNAFDEILAAIRRTPYRLLLLIDEYDNFANEVLVRDRETYEGMVHDDGPFKYLFKWVKASMAGAGLERLFMTGVSPMVLSDVTSGMNILENISLEPEFGSLCGFTDVEVHGLLAELHGERSAEGRSPWTVEEAHGVMRTWYNGYRFCPTEEAETGVYNPTLVHYFLKYLQRRDDYPDQMLDTNLAVDESKLDYLARAASGRRAVMDLVQRDEPLEIGSLRDRFTLRDLLNGSPQDHDFLGAYLYYFGLVTFAGRTPRRTWLLETPNEVVRGLFLERIRRYLLPADRNVQALVNPARDVMEGKDIKPLLDAVERELFPSFSNRDASWANELTVKTVFLTLLWDAQSYSTYSEPELDRRYADLCFLRRPTARNSSLWDLLFEFKRLSLKDLGMSGAELKKAHREQLLEHSAVREALTRAREQLDAYEKALERRLGSELKLRSYSVIALGFERLVAEQHR